MLDWVLDCEQDWVQDSALESQASAEDPPWLQYLWSTLVSITVHEAQGWGCPLKGSCLTSASVCPALPTGYRPVLSEGKQLVIDLIRSAWVLIWA